MKRLNLACKMTLFYMAMMGIAMFVSNYIIRSRFGEERMWQFVLGYALITTIYAIIAYRIYFKQEGFGNFKTIKISPLFILFSVGILVTFAVFIATGDFNNNWEMFVILAIMTLLMGISEELIFRGILLDSLLKTNSNLSAVFLSAMIFSGYHLVCLLGGMAFRLVILQMLTAFIYGILVSCFAIQIQNIFPIMLFHWIWDLMTVSISVVGSKAGPGILIITIAGIVSALFLILAISYKQPAEK